MKKILSTSEVLEVIEDPQGSWEILANGEARYDEDRQSLEVLLSTSVRAVDGQTPPPAFPWLPPSTAQQEKVSLSEAVAVAKEIFHSWTRRIRRSMPDKHLHTQRSGL